MTLPLDLAGTTAATTAAQDRSAELSRTRDAEKAAKMFESMLLSELLKAMRATVPETEDDSSDFARSTVDSMFDEALADEGSGRLGLGSLLQRQLGADLAGPPVASRTLQGPLALGTSSPAPAPRPADLGATFSAAVPGAGELPVEGTETSGFGFRLHPIHGERRFHEGLDLAAPEGTEVRAVQAGVVRAAGWQGSYGKTVEIEHPDGSLTRYAHTSRIHVRVGDRVDTGETIADVGQTGSATGPHLHFEALVDGRAIDPNRYLAGLRHRTTTESTPRWSGLRAPMAERKSP